VGVRREIRWGEFFLFTVMWLLAFAFSFLCSLAAAQEHDEQSRTDAPQDSASQEETAHVKSVPVAPPAASAAQKNLFSISLNGAYWPSLGDKALGSPMSNSSKNLSSLGVALAGAYHRHIVHWDMGDLYLGGEAGLLNFDNSQDSIPPNQLMTGKLDARLWYAGPSLKFMMGKGRLRYYIGAGGGYYEVSIWESNEIPRPPCTNIGPCLNTVNSLHRSTFGGFVSVGADIIVWTTQSGWQWRVRLEDQIHFLHFGSLNSFAPGVGNLSGPINVMQIGGVLAF